MRLKWLLPRMGMMVVATVLTLEIGVRITGEWTADGQLLIQHKLIPPLSVPLERHRAMVADYEAHSAEAYIGYDAQTGWGFIPNRVSQNGLYHINSVGFRAPIDYDDNPPDDTLRLALFGDSFAAGDEVPYENTYGYYLEQALGAQGIRVEVLNFGVPAYAMDQAYLRWLHLGQQFNPDIVLFGFQPENIERNTNVIRSLYLPTTGTIFSKPRFVLDGDNLQLVNSPALTADEVTAVLEHIDTHPMMVYERYYDERYQPFFGSFSAAYRWIRFMSIGEQPIVKSIPPGDERHLVTVAILRTFATQAQAAGSEFIVVHFPNYPAVALAVTGQTQPHQYMLDEIAAFARVLPAEQAFPTNDDRYWTFGLHYSAEGNQLVAQYSADALQTCLRNASCLPERFRDEARFWTND